jgi:hypothetical protein
MTNNKLTLALGLIAVAGIALITGCGSDESSGASLTKAQFQKKANLICNAASNEQFEKAGIYFKKHPQAEEADFIEPAGIPPLEKELKELQDLSAPSELQEQLDGYFEEFEKGLEKLKAEPQLALSPQDNPFEKANSLAEKYKLGDCSDTP